MNKHVSEGVAASDHETAFVSSMKNASGIVDRAFKFESDLVSHINPNAKKVDKMFAFLLSPHCETTHEGMKMVFADMGQSLRFIDVDGDGKVALHPNAMK